LAWNPAKRKHHEGILDCFVTPKSDFSAEYWNVFSAVPHFTNTAFIPFIKNLGETENNYLDNKGAKL
jgi:hypothetical protein